MLFRRSCRGRCTAVPSAHGYRYCPCQCGLWQGSADWGRIPSWDPCHAPPGCAWKRAKRSMSGSPFALQVSFTTVKGRAIGIGHDRLFLNEVPFQRGQDLLIRHVFRRQHRKTLEDKMLRGKQVHEEMWIGQVGQDLLFGFV